MASVQEKKTEELKQQTNQIFNIAERPVMLYIASFLDEPCNIVFKDEVPKKSDPLILKPFEEYKEDVYLKFTLKLIDLKDDDPNRIKNIDNIIQHQHVKDSLGFLLYCVKCAYPSIVASSLINNKPLLQVNIELNEDNWTFYPRYVNDQISKKQFFEDSISKIMHIKNQKEEPIPDKMMKDLNAEYVKIIDQLSKLEITDAMMEEQKKINSEYVDKKVLGIFVEELNKDQLPKPNFKPDDLLPLISNKSYEDPV